MKKKILNNHLYSLDKLVISFKLRSQDVSHLMQLYSVRTNYKSWESRKIPTCKYNYSIELIDDFGELQSFYVGFAPNWERSTAIITCRVEFNPSKVGDILEFLKVYGEIISCTAPNFIQVHRFDLAIDIPVPREKLHMVKDSRLYEEFARSRSDRTQYLGQRNNHGRVKLYNKALEQKLDIDLTRLELTIDYDKKSLEEIKKILPKIYIMDSLQYDIDLSSTDKMLLVAVAYEPSLINELSRRKKDKLSTYLTQMEMALVFDIDKYNSILAQIQEYTDVYNWGKGKMKNM